MPVLESQDNKIAPKSILRHRPIDDPVGSPSSAFPVAQRRASRTHKNATLIDDIPEWKGATTTTKRQKGSPTQVAKFPVASGGAKTARRFSRPRVHLSKPAGSKQWGLIQAPPWLYLGLGMIVMLLLWMLLSAAFGWFTTTLDTIRYGYPRTYQVDAWVGHHEETGKPSHFIALNLNRHIEIIEIAGDDPSHTRIFNGPVLYGAHDDLTPVTLRFVTPPGKKYPNMIVQFGGSQLIYLNENGTFLSQ